MRKERGFTLVELLVATAVVSLLALLVFQVISLTLGTWSSSRDKVGAFQDARLALGRMQATLGRAVLNPRMDYANAAGNPRSFSDPNFIATKILRASDLHFVSGPAASLIPGGSATRTPGSAVFFQAPLGFSDDPTLAGANELLNSTGFYVEFGEDTSPLPPFLSGLAGSGGSRFRLKQWLQPAELNRVYSSTASLSNSDFYSWFRAALPAAPSGSPPSGQLPSRTLAEDVFAFFVVPSVSPGDEAALGGPVAGDFCYDSRAWQNRGGLAVPGMLGGVERREIMRNQLPPFIKVAVLALEKRDADRLQSQHGNAPPPELAIPADLFTDSQKLDEDLVEFERRLLSLNPPLRPRIFRANIPLLGARWSNQ